MREWSYRVRSRTGGRGFDSPQLHEVRGTYAQLRAYVPRPRQAVGREEDAAHGVHGPVMLGRQPPSVVTIASALRPLIGTLRWSRCGLQRPIRIRMSPGHRSSSTYDCGVGATRAESGRGMARRTSPMIEPLLLTPQRAKSRRSRGGSILVAPARMGVPRVQL